MVIQTKKQEMTNMLINEQLLTNYEEVNPVDDEEDDTGDGGGGAPVKDDGGGGRGAYSIDNIDMYVHFDASTITSADYNTTTKQFIKPPINLATETPFSLNTRQDIFYPPSYDYGGMHCISGNIKFQLPDKLHNLYPDDIDISCLSVHTFKNVGTLQNWGSLFHITAIGGGYYGHFGVSRTGRSMNYTTRVNWGGLNATREESNRPPITIDKREIIYTQLKYDSREDIWHTMIKVYNIDGSNEFDEDEFNTQPRRTNNHDFFFVGGFSEYNQFSNFVIYEQILHTRSLTDTELENSVTFLSNKWNN
jgi:hypothetical protein